ncbi:MAG: cell division protease FtsH [bacterium]|jgi:cell division protease FtsH
MFPLPRNFIVIIAIILGAWLFYNLSQETTTNTNKPFSEFLSQAESRQIKHVVIKGGRVIFSTNDNLQYTANIPRYYENLIPILSANNINFVVAPTESGGFFFALLSSWLPVILIIGVWLFFMKQMQGGNKVMGFGKSKPRMLDMDKEQVTFADVAGIDESKAEVDEVVEFLRDPNKFEKLGGKIPRGVLLVGGPGTGKTLLAKAIAGEAGVAFFSISGSDFVEMFVGVGASRVRDLFSQARENSPCIIFIDEIDAVGRQRGAGLGGGNDEREQTLNQLLVEMDGFSGNEGVIVIAATNRPDVLDPALTRPGRFDRQVVVPPPDLKGRTQILDVHTKNIQISDDVNLEIIAKGTPGFTGADLANLANEAALLAGRKNKTKVEMIDFEEAKDKVMMGSERRSMVVSDEEKETTAYHEAGHAIVAILTPKVDPVHKVSIIPRGQALGVTMLLPEQDNHSQHYSEIVGMLGMMMGGRAAEELIFNHFTTGASNDLERATAIAHKMVCSWGMSKTVGPMFLTSGGGEVFLGRDMMQRSSISQQLAKEVDDEINLIVNDAYSYAMDLLKKNMGALKEVTRVLLEEETIDGKKVNDIIEQYVV